MTGPDDEPTGGDPEEGPVLSPEEIDISDDERVRELEEGRFVVSSGDPIAQPDDGPAGQIEGETGSAPARREEQAAEPEPAPEPTPQSTGTDAPSAPEPELTARSVHNWLSDDLAAVNSRYGFDITAAFDGAVSQQRMVSNDVVTIFETLVMWYAQQVDRNTPIEEVLGILLTEANVPVEIPPEALKRALVASDLSPDDSIADLMTAVQENDGLQL
jgi:pyruvate/2-oxoglutarate dehydrogenase complex dihydrolipoamide acyltransferase (E2) component